MLILNQVLTAQELSEVHALLAHAGWSDGRHTAGTQSAQVKNNQQLPEEDPNLAQARSIVIRALHRDGQFFSYCLPKQIFPPLFNRYRDGMHFGPHIDNAVRTHAPSGMHVRTDISATLFLNDPTSYDGGELVIQDTFGIHQVKLEAGDMVIYPGSTLHWVNPVTRGVRDACFFWVQSMVRSESNRDILYRMDEQILALRQRLGDCAELVQLTGCYHNLIRTFADV